MQFRQKRIIKPVVNVAPVVDVLFLLLIFFMVTSTFVEQPNIKLELPTTKHMEASRIDMIVLTISRGGRLFLQDEPVERNDLMKSLRKIVVETGERTLVLKSDKWIPYGFVVDIMDDARGAGFKRVIAPTIMEE